MPFQRLKWFSWIKSGETTCTLISVLSTGAVFGWPLQGRALVRDAFHSIPSLMHQAVNDIRTWWNQK
jgi:hypothetical protein